MPIRRHRALAARLITQNRAEFAYGRIESNLQNAATLDLIAYDPSTGDLSFRIQNQTGHKLISGFPEGRRMFVNVQAYAGGEKIYEVNPYDEGAGTLKGLSIVTTGTGTLVSKTLSSFSR